MSTKIADPDIGDAALVQIIRTGQSSPEGVGKGRAIVALRRSSSTLRRGVFSALLADRRELARYRNMAAAGLLELGGVRAEQALLDNVPHADPETAGALARGLGRIGSPGAASAIRKLLRLTPIAVRGPVRFAASVLAYRHNLRGHEVKAPAGAALLRIAKGARAKTIEVAKARRSDFNLALDALRREPLGLDLVADNALALKCDPNSFLLLWNRDFVGQNFAELRERKGVAGALFRRSRFDKDYSAAGLVLGTPGTNGVKITVHKGSGEVLLAGTVSFRRGGVTTFDLRSVRRPGAATVELSGKIGDGGEIVVSKARSSGTVLERKSPKRDPHRGE